MDQGARLGPGKRKHDRIITLHDDRARRRAGIVYPGSIYRCHGDHIGARFREAHQTGIWHGTGLGLALGENPGVGRNRVIRISRAARKIDRVAGDNCNIAGR